jgi:predicted NBD/HSP70 family sugar kinase
MKAARLQAATERVRAAEAERQSLATILNLIRSGRAETRQDIEREARLGRAVVADRLATLSGFGLIDESGLGRSLGGRAPRLVRFQPDCGRLLVATVERDTIGVGVADLAGRLLIEHYEDIELGTSPAALAERLTALFTWLVDRDRGREPWGIGLGLAPGVDLPLRLGAEPAVAGVRTPAESFRAPIWVRSAIQMATFGEVGALPADRAQDLLFVDLGADITAGVVAAGRLLSGAQGAAGQIGHVYAGEGHMAVCGCGNIGCLQTAAGCDVIAREGMLGGREGHSQALADVLARSGTVTVADIGVAARLGDPFSAELLRRSGRLIGTALATLVNMLNPATILLGGELAQTGDICLAAIRESIYRHSQPLVTRDLIIQRSRMIRSSGLAGAAAVVVGEIFAPPFLENWITAGSPLGAPPIAEDPVLSMGGPQRGARKPVP